MSPGGPVIALVFGLPHLSGGLIGCVLANRLLPGASIKPQKGNLGVSLAPKYG